MWYRFIFLLSLVSLWELKSWNNECRISSVGAKFNCAHIHVYKKLWHLLYVILHLQYFLRLEMEFPLKCLKKFIVVVIIKNVQIVVILGDNVKFDCTNWLSITLTSRKMGGVINCAHVHWLSYEYCHNNIFTSGI